MSFLFRTLFSGRVFSDESFPPKGRAPIYNMLMPRQSRVLFRETETESENENENENSRLAFVVIINVNEIKYKVSAMNVHID